MPPVGIKIIPTYLRKKSFAFSASPCPLRRVQAAQDACLKVARLLVKNGDLWPPKTNSCEVQLSKNLLRLVSRDEDGCLGHLRLWYTCE